MLVFAAFFEELFKGVNVMQIRPAEIGDVPKLREFEQGVIATERPLALNLKPDPINYYDLEGMITSEQFALLVGEEGGELIACGYGRLDKSAAHFQSDLNVYLGFMFVTPDNRGQGLSSLIMDALSIWMYSCNQLTASSSRDCA